MVWEVSGDFRVELEVGGTSEGTISYAPLSKATTFSVIWRPVVNLEVLQPLLRDWQTYFYLGKL